MAGLVTYRDQQSAPTTSRWRRARTRYDDAGGQDRRRSARDCSAVRSQALPAIDPELPLYSVRTMDDRIDETLTDRRTPMMLAVTVRRRRAVPRRDRPLRRARLPGGAAAQGDRDPDGARQRAGRHFRPGSARGARRAGRRIRGRRAGAFAIRRAMETQLYGVGAMDPAVLALVGGVLAVVALIACSVPAARGARSIHSITLRVIKRPWRTT